jgi:hypothetical protein
MVFHSHKRDSAEPDRLDPSETQDRMRANWLAAARYRYLGPPEVFQQVWPTSARKLLIPPAKNLPNDLLQKPWV